MNTTMNVLNRVKFEHSELIDAAEQVLIAMAADPSGVDPSDEYVFRVLGWDERRVARELGRVSAVQRFRSMAGTNAQFAESVEVAEAYSQSVPLEVAKLDRKLEELQAKRYAEQSKLDDAKRRVDAMENARSQLRTLIPQHVRTRFEKEMNLQMGSGVAETLRELKNRRTHIQGVLEKLSTVDSTTIRQIVLYCENHLRDAIPEPSPNSDRGYRLNEHLWAEHLASLRVELSQIESEIPSLQAEHDESVAAVETILDYYVSEKDENHGN